MMKYIIKVCTAAMMATFCVGHVYSADYEIKMLNSGAEGKMIFEPSVLKVKVGDTVTFLPSDRLHDSISIHTPKDANTWHGKRDQKVSVIINKEGIYIYKCSPHFYYGMVGVIYTEKSPNINKVKAVSATISRQFIMHKNRLIDYVSSIQ